MIGRNGNWVSNFTGGIEGDLRICPDFQLRCIEKLEKRADMANDHGVAIGHYLERTLAQPGEHQRYHRQMLPGASRFSGGGTRQRYQGMNGLVHCAKLMIVMLCQVIEHDPSNYKGYRKQYSVLHSMGRFREAFGAFEMMLSTMKNSVDPQVCGEPVGSNPHENTNLCRFNIRPSRSISRPNSTHPKGR
jgi:hypothetical protein